MPYYQSILVCCILSFPFVIIYIAIFFTKFFLCVNAGCSKHVRKSSRLFYIAN